jgi:HD-like signal output (HDOD) protein
MGFESESGKVENLPWAHLRLPPFPRVAIRVLQLANNENVQLHQLCELISSDPAFASEVLTVANSVLYSPRYPSSNILQAIAVLGANTLRGMCITVGARAYLGKSMNYPAMRGVWRHNLACAIIAGRMASAGSLDRDTAYTSGILHDIGRIALAVILPKEYASLLGSHRGSPDSILEGERGLFGWDHCETGRRLISEWKLSSEFSPVVSEHHCVQEPGEAWGMNELVKTSCRMADSAGFPAFPGCETTSYQELLKELPAQGRGNFCADLETLAAEVANGIRAIESV